MEDKEYSKIKLLHEQVQALTQSGTWELDLQKDQLSWSDSVFTMLGYEPQEFEVTFEKGVKVIHPDDRERSTALLEKAIKNDSDYFIEKRLITKSGNTIHVRSKATIFKDDAGKPINAIGVFQDISDFVESRKELQTQNSLTQDIIRKLPSAFFLFNQSSELLLWNEEVLKITGYNPEEISSMTVQDLFEGDQKEKVGKHIEEVLQDGYTDLEAWLTPKEGGKVPLFFTASIIQYKGERCIFGTGTDITERLSLLHELQLLLNNTEEAFAYVDDELNFISFNQQMRVHSELLFQKELKKGMKITELAHPEQMDDLNKILKEVWKGNETEEIIKIEGEKELEFYKLKFKPIHSAAKKVQGIFLTFLNVTEAQKANYALQESKEKLQEVLDNSLDTLCTIDEEGIFQMVSKSCEQLWGYKPEEMEGQPFMDFVIENDRASTTAVAEEMKKEGKKVRNFQNHYRHKNGHIVAVVWSAYWSSDQKLLNGVARDATDLLKAEEQLLKSEERFKALVQEGGDLIAILDLEGIYKYVSPTSKHILGIEPEYFRGKNAFDFIHPDDKEWAIKEFGKLADEQSIQLPPFRFLNSEGEWRWIESFISNLLMEPAVQGIVANSRDVTEKVKLRQTLDNATKLARVGAWEINQKTGEHYWSPITKEIHDVPNNFTPDLDQAINFYHPNFRQKVEEAVDRAEKNGESFDFEAIIITGSGQEKWVRAIGNSEIVEGKCLRLFGSFQDIHDRKMAEERLTNISDNIPGVLFQFHLRPDGTDTVDLVSKGAKEIFGISAEDWIENPNLIWANIEKGGDLDSVQESIQKSAETLERWVTQWRYIMPDGSVRFHEGSGNPIRKQDGTVIWDSIIMDITENKIAEEQIKSANIALERQNKVLKEIAWTQSHEVRAPLARLMGIITALENKRLSNTEKENLFGHLMTSARELDDIIRSVVNISKVIKIEEK